MSVLAWVYLSGAALTLSMIVWLGGRARSVGDVAAVLMLVLLWPGVWVMAVAAALGDTDEPPW